MEQYKKKLDRFADSVCGESESDKSARPPSLLMTHFTSSDNAKSIIQTRTIKTNTDQYVSFTELNPFEFNTITQNRDRCLGFGFFKEELLDEKIDLFVPLAFAEQDKHDEILQILQNNNFRKYIAERSALGKSSILFSNMLEIRSSQIIPLKFCRLFFRNEDIIGPDFEEVLSDLGIFQLPHRVLWYSGFFLQKQMWVYKEEADYVIFYDNKSKPYVEGEKVISSAELIAKIEGKQKR